MATLKDSKVYRASRWLDVRQRRLGMWAYVLNRVTGIGLVIYLYLHLAILSMLSRGPGAWDAFVSLARSPFFLSLDAILLAGILIHGLNGLRVALLGFGIGVNMQKVLFGLFMGVVCITLGVAIFQIFGG